MRAADGFALPAGSCACTHLRTKHSGACTFRNCGCPRSRWSWSLVDGVLVVLRALGVK